MKKWVVLNLTAPLALAVAAVMAARGDGRFFLLFMLFIVVVLGLAITSLVAPFSLWRGHGVRSFLVPLSIIASAGLGLVIQGFGSDWMLRATPARPETFLKGTRQEELKRLGEELLATPNSNATRERLGDLGFHRVQVDTARRVVRMSYARLRTWFEYLYAPDGLPGRYARSPRLANADVNDWRRVHEIASVTFGSSAGGDSDAGPGIRGGIAGAIIRRAYGDSLLTDVAARDPEDRTPPEERRHVISALNEQLRPESGLLSNTAVTCEGDSVELHVESRVIPARHWAAALLRELLREGVVERQPDGRHLRLRSGLTDVERARVEWLQLGLLQIAFDDFVDVDTYPYDRRLREHWYIRIW